MVRGREEEGERGTRKRVTGARGKKSMKPQPRSRGCMAGPLQPAPPTDSKATTRLRRVLKPTFSLRQRTAFSLPNCTLKEASRLVVVS